MAQQVRVLAMQTLGPELKSSEISIKKKLGMAMCACNPSTAGGRGKVALEQ